MAEILWRSSEQGSSERFTDRATATGRELAGVVILPVDGAPSLVRYRIDLDAGGRTRAVDVEVEGAGTVRRLALVVEPGGRWLVDGRHDPALDGALDVDLAFTPATNTLVMRRLAFADGRPRTVPVAWLTYPELQMQRSEQTYTRLAADRWRFAVPGFEAELEVDADQRVLRYGDDLWTAVATAA